MMFNLSPKLKNWRITPTNLSLLKWTILLLLVPFVGMQAKVFVPPTLDANMYPWKSLNNQQMMANPSVLGIAVTSEVFNGTNLDISVSTTGLNLPNGSLENSTVNSNTVKLFVDATNVEITMTIVNSTGGGDAITLTALGLEYNTTYRLEISNGVEDLTGETMIPFSDTFSTCPDPGNIPSSIEFEKVTVTTGSQYTTVTIGPDGKLYGLVNNGIIHRWTIAADGTLSNQETINSLQTAEGGSRLAIGLDFDPSSTAGNLIAWVSHTTFGFSGMADWGGKISQLSGPDLATVQDYVINLPRSTRDHVTNGIDFGPDGALYFVQGSNSAMGASDGSWGNRPERMLAAAALRLDPSLIPNPPLDVQTSEGGTYDPFAPGAPLTLWATGVRNAYDLVWHSNGNMYIPTNGSAAGGNTPETPGFPNAPSGVPQRIDGLGDADLVATPAINGVSQTQNDQLFRAVQGGYHGHPNPARGEYIMNGGNPTANPDPVQVNQYAEGTLPDPNWRGFAFNFLNNKSPNGVIEYKSNTFSGALQGKILVVRYSGGDDIITLTPGGLNQDIIDAQTGVTGFTSFNNPLDLTENIQNGHIYVAEYGSSGKITLLRPVGSTGGAPNLVLDLGRPYNFNPNEVYFSTPKNSTDVQTFTIENTGGTDLTISGLTIGGTDASKFSVTIGGQAASLPLIIAAGNTETIEVTFSPTGTVGPLEGTLTIASDDPTNASIVLGLYGASANGIEGGNEVPWSQLNTVLGYNIDIGWTSLGSNTNTIPIGDEVEEPLFRKAGSGNVEMIPIGRYSPDWLLPFGYYLNNNNSPILNEVGQLSASSNPPEHQTVFPEIVNGGTTFDPGANDFGLYTTSPSHTAYSEDALNALLEPTKVEHAVRIYEMKDRNGNTVADTYLLGFEEASNGDYNDYMFVLTNVEPASNVVVPPATATRINVGGSVYTTVGGDAFSADNPSIISGSTTVGSKTFDVTGTDDDDLYLTYRFGPSFTVDVPVDNGTYDVNLYFAEIFFGAPGGGAGNTGARVFDVTVEGAPLINDLDLVAEAGGGAAYIENLTSIVVNDGQLTLEFLASTNNAIINAIEIIPGQPAQNNPPVVDTPTADQSTEVDQAYSLTIAPFSDPDAGDQITYTAFAQGQAGLPGWLSFNANTLTFSGTPAVTDLGITTIVVTGIDNNGASVSDEFDLAVFHPNDQALRINAGGPNYTTLAGDLYLADLPNLIQGETQTSSKSFDVIGTDDDPLYLLYRFGENFTYQIPVENGSYDINLKLAEIFQTGTGNRVYDVNVEGQLEIDDLDLVAVAGGATAYNAAIPNITVTDGVLDIQFVFSVDNALINGIEILPAGAPGNNPPTVANPIPDQSVTEGMAFSYQFPETTFNDVDQGDVLTYAATEQGEAGLPAWLSFDDATRTFSGTPGVNDVGTLTVIVTATDNNNASVADVFNIDVTAVPVPIVRISFVDPTNDEIHIENFGTAAVDITNYRLCSEFSYTGDLTGLTIQNGSLNLSAGATVELTGVALTDAAADLGLYLPGGSNADFADQSQMVDFVQWGSAGNGRENIADAAGIWVAGTFIDGPAPYNYIGDGIENGVAFWTVDICSPIALTGCDAIPVDITNGFCLEFDSDAGGLDDGASVGTGFTMVAEPSNFLDPAVPSNPDVPGYEPSKLSIAGGNLTFTATKGIFFKATNTGNSQVNGLGVGINANQPQAFDIVTKMVNLPVVAGGNNFQQAGIWFGLDEATYVKLVVLVNSANGYELQLSHEKNENVNAGPDQQDVTGDVIPIGGDVILKMTIDPQANTVSGFYSLDDGATFLALGSAITLAPGMITGQLLPDGSSSTTFAGLHTSIRNASASSVMNFAFDRFCINEPAPVQADLTITTSLQGRSDYSGDYEVNIYDIGQVTPAYTFTATADAGGVMTMNGIPPGTYQVAVKHPQYLQRVLSSVSLVAGSNSETVTELLVGDANNDNFVSALDFSVLASVFNLNLGDQGYDPRPDFNQDDKISALDFSLFVINFNTIGEEPSGSN